MLARALRSREYALETGKFVLAGYLGLTEGTLPERIVFPELEFPEETSLPAVEVYLDQALAARGGKAGKKMRTPLNLRKKNTAGRMENGRDLW